MKKFVTTEACYREWKNHPFTKVLFQIIDQERRSNGLHYTTNVNLGRDPSIIVQEIAKLRGIQEVWEMFAEEGELRKVLLDPYIEWDAEV